MAAMPVYAEDYALWPAQSELFPSGTPSFISFVDEHQSYDVSSGDTVYWYNWWTNQYGGEVDVYLSYKYEGQSQPTDTLVEESLGYHEAKSVTAYLGAQQATLYRYHKYDSDYTDNVLIDYLT